MLFSAFYYKFNALARPYPIQDKLHLLSKPSWECTHCPTRLCIQYAEILRRLVQ